MNDMDERNHYKEEQKTQAKRSFKEYFQLGEVAGYFFRKKDPERPSNINLRMMHGINKFSVIVFLLGVIYFIIKQLFNGY